MTVSVNDVAVEKQALIVYTTKKIYGAAGALGSTASIGTSICSPPVLMTRSKPISACRMASTRTTTCSSYSMRRSKPALFFPTTTKLRPKVSYLPDSCYADPCCYSCLATIRRVEPHPATLRGLQRSCTYPLDIKAIIRVAPLIKINNCIIACYGMIQTLSPNDSWRRIANQGYGPVKPRWWRIVLLSKDDRHCSVRVTAGLNHPTQISLQLVW